MEYSFSSNSLFQLQSELGTSCSGRSEQDCFGSGVGFRNYSAFERFTLLRELNSGATATVYEAVERRSNTAEWSGSKHVALKILNSRPGGGYILPLTVIQQEIHCAKQLAHPNIANLLDVVAHEGHLALAFELVRGHDLLEYIKRCHNRLPEHLCLHYFRQLLSAVWHMHSRGIAHRDLKPENCMIDPSNHTLKVIDFGLAAPLEAHLPPGCGTLNTIAPECIVQEGRPPAQDSVAVDIWGLGVTLYITLAGRFPFQDERRPNNDQQQVYNTLRGRLNPFRVEPSAAAKELVLSMLQTDPAKRPSLEQVANHPWVTQAIDSPMQLQAADATMSSLYPFSPSASDSANSDQTAENAHIDTPLAKSLTFILEKYLTTNGAERHLKHANGKLGSQNQGVSSKPKQKAKSNSSALQPEIIEAALMQDMQSEAVPSTEEHMDSDAAELDLRIPSVFGEAQAQSQDFSFEMPGCGSEMPDDSHLGFGTGLWQEEQSWTSDRPAIKLFTLSQEDIGQSPSPSPSPSRSLTEGLELGRMSCGQFSRLASVPEAAEEEEEALALARSVSTPIETALTLARGESPRAACGMQSMSPRRNGLSLRPAYSHSLDIPLPAGTRAGRKAPMDPSRSRTRPRH